MILFKKGASDFPQYIVVRPFILGNGQHLGTFRNKLVGKFCKDGNWAISLWGHDKEHVRIKELPR